MVLGSKGVRVVLHVGSKSVGVVLASKGECGTR